MGEEFFSRTENLRRDMSRLRDEDAPVALAQLEETYAELERLEAGERRAMASAYTLMLELMNVCESAYRSHRLSARAQRVVAKGEKPEAIIWVLTAHPTEARSPQNIAIFHEILAVLVRALDEAVDGEHLPLTEGETRAIQHWLEVAWRASIVRDRSPRVKDEAESIYATVLREEVLLGLLERAEERAPFYLRSWVGGDKDGHPGVDETQLLQSLTLSRAKILEIVRHQLERIDGTVALIALAAPRKRLQAQLGLLLRELRGLRKITRGDAKRIVQWRAKLVKFRDEYLKEFSVRHPGLTVLRRLFHVFPALVVPLEIRESSDVLHSKPEPRKTLAIDRMLASVAAIAQGGDPRWYVRGFIISMTRTLADIEAAAAKSKRAFGSLALPIVPLFEELSSLGNAESIIGGVLAKPELARAAREKWDGYLEVMVGYSDSSKEAGVLASRLAIAETLLRLERVIEGAGLKPVFFHGSGGSVDRGGGSIEDQTAWWPRSALRNYKVTVQGEMVERSFATPAIAEGQLEKTNASIRSGLTAPVAFSGNEALKRFAAAISSAYRSQVASAQFLELVEKATPYAYLSALKMGSRPSKRATSFAVSALRAIPWILCWTQTRVLFPTWWGVGRAWASTSEIDRAELRRMFASEAVFTSYVKALGFTLAKVELPVFQMYLRHSALTSAQVESISAEFAEEFEKTLTFFRELTGEDNPLFFRPWLRESIRLRSAMIHPLNLLQILSEQGKDAHLLRITVTGISSGMMTTG